MTARLSFICFILVNTALGLCIQACQRTPSVTPSTPLAHHDGTHPSITPSLSEQPLYDAAPDLPEVLQLQDEDVTPRFITLNAPLDPVTICETPPAFTKTSFAETNQIARPHDPTQETIHFPSALGADEPITFRRKRNRLYLPIATNGEPDDTVLSWTPARASDAQISAGLIRARIVPHTRLDLTVRLHAQELSEAIGVTFSTQGASLTHIHEDGTHTPLTRTEVLYGLDKRKEIELIATVLPTHVHVQIHDTRSGVELTSLTSRLPDTLLTTPHIMHPSLIVSSQHTSSTRAHLTLLSTRPLCATDALKTSPIDKPPRLFTTLDAEQASLLDEPMWLAQREDDHARYQIAPHELEALHCQGVVPDELSTEIPWAAIDGDYRRYRLHPVVEDTHGGFHTSLSLKNPGMTQALMTAFHERFPTHTRLIEIGRSHTHTPIMALAVARDIQPDDPRPSILLNGAHHGDELMSTEIVFDAMRMLLSNPDEDPRVDTWLDTFVIWLVPQVNPDGAQAFLETSYRMGRKNGRVTDTTPQGLVERGVDLNRNYPFQWGALGEVGSSSAHTSPHYRGEVAASEPETQALMALAEQEHFAASISYHTGTVCIIAPYTIDGVPQPAINDAWELGRHISRRMPQHPEKRSFRLLKNLYPVDGTDQDWFRAEFGTAALLVEAVRRTPRDTCSRLAVIDANRPSYTLLLDRMLKGPSITGTVQDDQGRRVIAELVIEEQELKHGESWETRARDGHYFRLLKRAGTYTIRVDAPGYTTWRQRVKVSATSPTQLDVTLTTIDHNEDVQD